MKSKIFIFTIAFFLVSGCAAPTHRTEVKISPTAVENKIDFITADITPVCTNRGCEFFKLNVKNNLDKPVEINWNKTLFISGGQTSGGFMYEGIAYKDRNDTRPPDIVFQKGAMSKTIAPNNLASFTSGRGWSNEYMPHGNIGVYLTITVDGKDYSQKMTTNVTFERVEIAK